MVCIEAHDLVVVVAVATDYMAVVTCTRLPSLSQNSCVLYTCVSTGTPPQNHGSPSVPAAMQTPGCWISSDYTLHQQHTFYVFHGPYSHPWFTVTAFIWLAFTIFPNFYNYFMDIVNMTNIPTDRGFKHKK